MRASHHNKMSIMDRIRQSYWVENVPRRNIIATLVASFLVNNNNLIIGLYGPCANFNPSLFAVLLRVVDRNRYGLGPSKVVGLFVLHLWHPGHDQLLHGQLDLERNGESFEAASEAGHENFVLA